LKKILKKTGPKSLEDIYFDLSKTYSQMLTNSGCFYFITITDTLSPHPKDLNFTLTNKLFNKIWNDYKKSLEVVNYIFVIEYPGAITKKFKSHKGAQIELELLDSCKVHSHIVLNTTLKKEVFESYIYSTFNNPNIKTIDITNNSKRGNLINYFKKQEYLNDECYNYKITLATPSTN
jgi:hypothetical protein